MHERYWYFLTTTTTTTTTKSLCQHWRRPSRLIKLGPAMLFYFFCKPKSKTAISDFEQLVGTRTTQTAQTTRTARTARTAREHEGHDGHEELSEDAKE